MNKKMSIEEALDQLEKAAEELKSDKLSIDESVKLFEKSKELYEYASGLLSETKQKIQKYDPEKDEVEDFDDAQL